MHAQRVVSSVHNFLISHLLIGWRLRINDHVKCHTSNSVHWLPVKPMIPGIFQCVALVMDGMRGAYSEYWVGGRTDHKPLTGTFTVEEVNKGGWSVF